MRRLSHRPFPIHHVVIFIKCRPSIKSKYLAGDGDARGRGRAARELLLFDQHMWSGGGGYQDLLSCLIRLCSNTLLIIIKDGAWSYWTSVDEEEEAVAVAMTN